MSKFSGMNMNQLAQFAVDNESLSSSDYMDYASAVIVVSFKENKFLVDENTRLLKKIKAEQDQIFILKSRCSDLVEDLFLELADEVSDKSSNKCGWFDSMAKSDAVRYGDELVELGRYEKHPDGHGRRWFYRPKKATEAEIADVQRQLGELCKDPNLTIRS